MYCHTVGAPVPVSLSFRDRLPVVFVVSAFLLTDKLVDVVLAAGVEDALVETGRGGLNTAFIAAISVFSGVSFDLKIKKKSSLVTSFHLSLFAFAIRFVLCSCLYL